MRLGCAALAVALMGIVGAVAIAMRAGRSPDDGGELVLTATDPALSIVEAETELCAPLESTFVAAGLHGWSEAREGECTVHAPLDGRDPTEASEAVHAALGGHAFVQAPTLSRRGRARALWIVIDGERSERELARIANELRRRVEAVDGVVEVEVCGRSTAREIVIDPERLAAYGLTILDAARIENVEVPAGRIEAGDRELAVRSSGSDDLASVVIAEREGRPIRLSDVAAISSGALDRPCVAASGGESVTALRVSIAASDAASALADIRERLPAAEGLRTTLIDAPIAIPLVAVSAMAPGPLSRDLSRAMGRPVVVVARPELRELDVLDEGDEGLRDRLAQPGLVVAVRAVPLGRIWVVGGSAAERDAATDRLRARLEGAGVLAAPASGTPRGVVAVRVDAERARRYGVVSEDLARTVALARGASVGSLDGENVRMRLAGIDDDPSALRGVMMRGTSGVLFPLSEVADVVQESSPMRLHRLAGEPAVLLAASADRAVRESEVTSMLGELELPAGVRVTFEPAE